MTFKDFFLGACIIFGALSLSEILNDWVAKKCNYDCTKCVNFDCQAKRCIKKRNRTN